MLIYTHIYILIYIYKSIYYILLNGHSDLINFPFSTQGVHSINI